MEEVRRGDLQSNPVSFALPDRLITNQTECLIVLFLDGSYLLSIGQTASPTEEDKSGS